MWIVLLVQRFGLVLGKQRLIFGKTSCDPGRYIGMLSRTGTPTSRPGRLLQTLVFGNGLARENDGLVSRRWAVFRTSALMRATFGAAGFRTATRICAFRRPRKTGLRHVPTAPAAAATAAPPSPALIFMLILL